MKIVARLLFWLALAGTALSMVAPLLFGGASYREAQPAVVLGLVVTLVMAAIAMPSSKTPAGADPYAHAKLRHRARTSYALIAAFMVGASSAVEMAVVYPALDRLRSSAKAIDMVDLADLAAGSWTGVIGLVAAGFALLLGIGFALQKPEPAPFSASPLAARPV